MKAEGRKMSFSSDFILGLSLSDLCVSVV